MKTTTPSPVAMGHLRPDKPETGGIGTFSARALQPPEPFYYRNPRNRAEVMTKLTGLTRDIYIRDANNKVVAVSEEGVRIESVTRTVAGGGLFDLPSDDSKPSSIVVLVAPSMERRFKAFEVTDSDTFLIRTDDVRCQINCDPILADGIASRNTVIVTEASGQPNGENLSYEVMVYSSHEPAMRM